MEYKLELVVLPVADIDRAKQFHDQIGFHALSKGIGTAPPGLRENVHLGDIEEAREDMADAGVDMSEPLRNKDGAIHHTGTEKREPTCARAACPTARSCRSGTPRQRLLLQEIVQRPPGQ